jgi:hypothetical protein
MDKEEEKEPKGYPKPDASYTKTLKREGKEAE